MQRIAYVIETIAFSSRWLVAPFLVGLTHGGGVPVTIAALQDQDFIVDVLDVKLTFTMASLFIYIEQDEII